jgi:hypothetical protein
MGLEPVTHLNDLTSTQCELERIITVQRAVKLAAIRVQRPLIARNTNKIIRQTSGKDQRQHTGAPSDNPPCNAWTAYHQTWSCVGTSPDGTATARKPARHVAQQ